jgi:hypothetical protein
MKKAITESESDALVLEELPKRISKKLSIEGSHVEVAGHSIEDELARRKSLLKNYYQNPRSQNTRETSRQHSDIEETKGQLHGAHASGLLIFRLNDDHTTVRAEWEKLPLRLKEVFEEISYSLPVSGISSTDDDGCYTFSYADDEYNLSVISIVIEGKAALFYKNLAAEES